MAEITLMGKLCVGHVLLQKECCQQGVCISVAIAAIMLSRHLVPQQHRCFL